MAQSFDTTIGNLVAGVTGAIGNVDTRVGTVLMDGILAPAAFEFTNVYNNMDIVSANQGIDTASLQSDASLESLGSNFGISRSIGSFANTTLRLFRYSQPTSNITIPLGTKAYTELSSTRISFSTLAAVSLTPTSPKDVGAGYYYVDCAASCDTAGEIGNVVAGGISYIEFVGIDGVINTTDASGGKSSQTNTELVATIESTARGNIGTRTGYEALIRTNFDVADVQVISGRDTDSIRSQYGGSIDVIVLDETKTPMTESYAFVNPVTTTQLIPTFKPLLSVTQIKGKDSGNNDVFLIAGTDYSVVYDTFTTNRRSNVESSKIILNITSFVPLNGSLLTMDYMYAPLIANVQSFITNEDNYVFGSDVLARLGIVVPVNVTGGIRILPGYNATSVRVNVETALTTYFNSLLLDNDIQNSDVINVITNVAGVDSLDVPSFVLARASAPAVSLQEVTVGRSEYIRGATFNITVLG